MSDPPYSLSSVRELAGKVAVHQHLCVNPYYVPNELHT